MPNCCSAPGSWSGSAAMCARRARRRRLRRWWQRQWRLRSSPAWGSAGAAAPVVAARHRLRRWLRRRGRRRRYRCRRCRLTWRPRWWRWGGGGGGGGSTGSGLGGWSLAARAVQSPLTAPALGLRGRLHRGFSQCPETPSPLTVSGGVSSFGLNAGRPISKTNIRPRAVMPTRSARFACRGAHFRRPRRSLSVDGCCSTSSVHPIGQSKYVGGLPCR